LWQQHELDTRVNVFWRWFRMFIKKWKWHVSNLCLQSSNWVPGNFNIQNFASNIPKLLGTQIPHHNVSLLSIAYIDKQLFLPLPTDPTLQQQPHILSTYWNSTMLNFNVNSTTSDFCKVYICSKVKHMSYVTVKYIIECYFILLSLIRVKIRMKCMIKCHVL
jgi:hypothetical protein